VVVLISASVSVRVRGRVDQCECECECECVCAWSWLWSWSWLWLWSWSWLCAFENFRLAQCLRRDGKVITRTARVSYVGRMCSDRNRETSGNIKGLRSHTPLHPQGWTHDKGFATTGSDAR
jgi:hypothetical protein